MSNNSKRLSFGQKGFTLVFDFPIYPKVFDVLDKLDLVILKNKGKIYLTKDSRISKENFKNINKEFKDYNLKKIRKQNIFFFSSIQYERLEI